MLQHKASKDANPVRALYWSAEARFEAMRMIYVLIKDGTKLYQANKLIVTATVLHEIILSEEIPSEYNLEEDEILEPHE